MGTAYHIINSKLFVRRGIGMCRRRGAPRLITECYANSETRELKPDRKEKPGVGSYPRLLAIKANALFTIARKPRSVLRLPIGGCLLFTTLGVHQGQVILGVKGVATNGLLSGGTKGNVDPPIVGQD
jgi:hypothetical protein